MWGRMGPTPGGKGPRPERNDWDSSYGRGLRDYAGPVRMHTLVPTRTKKATGARIDPRKHGLRGSKNPFTQRGAT